MSRSIREYLNISLNEAKKIDISKIEKESYVNIISKLDSISSDLENEYKDFEMGSGALEEWLEKKGVVVDKKDISKLKPYDVNCLLYNVFYNTNGGLSKLIPDSVLKHIIDKQISFIKKNPDMNPFSEDKRDIKHLKKRKKLAQYLVDKIK